MQESLAGTGQDSHNRSQNNSRPETEAETTYQTETQKLNTNHLVPKEAGREKYPLNCGGL
jgi:hypothetical protein